MNSKLSPICELISYNCSDCNGTSWKLYIGKEEDRTSLIICCANETCLEKKRKELGADKNAFIIWDEIPLPEGYYTNYDKVEPTEVN